MTSPPQPNILSAVPYFDSLDAETVAELERSTVQQMYDTEQIVFLEGETCAGLYIVESGWLKSVKIALSGREQVIRFVGPGEVFNEVGILADARNQVTVIALEPTALWIIPQEPLLHLMDKNARLSRIIAQHLARRVQHLLGLVEDLSLRPLQARLARVILEQATEGVVRRHRWSTQTEMASRLGTVPDVLNRALRGLVEEGLISVQRYQIQIRDRAGLEAKATREG